MLFSELAIYFEKLESTSSRLALIDILADLFRKSSEEDIEKIIYLTQGRIAPFFEALEIGMAEKQVAGAIATSLNIKRDEVLNLYSKLGDMGLAVEQLNSKLETRNSKLTVREVFGILTEIAKTKGEGTVEKRQILLSDLLKKMNAGSSKYLVRIPLGNLRLGIGDPTILDGLALAKLGDKSNRKLLEGAYNRTSDLGLIAKTLWEKDLNAVSKLQVVVGKPIRSELCERLPNAEKVIEKMGVVDAQPKYDGFRCITGFTPVYASNKGITSVRDIQIGDKVLTKTGEFVLVIAKHKRRINKKVKIIYDITEWYPSKKNLFHIKGLKKPYTFIKLLLFNFKIFYVKVIFSHKQVFIV